MKKDEEKVTMEVTKSEAMFVLFDRLENKWYVDLEPIFIFLPGMGIAYLVYSLIAKSFNTWWGVSAVVPIMVLGIYLLLRQMKKRRIKAETLYEEMKAN